MADIETLVRWLVKMQLAEISGIVHDKSRSQEIRGLYFARVQSLCMARSGRRRCLTQ